MEHERRFWWHWRNDSLDRVADKSKGVFPLEGRAWWHFGYGTKRSKEAHIQWLLGKRSTSFRFDFGHGEESGWGFGFAVPFLVTIHFSINGLFPKFRDKKTGWSASREVSLRIFGWSIWWNIWVDPMGGHSYSGGKQVDPPRWRDGSFNIPRFFLGREKYSKVEIETRNVLVPMPEGPYEATATLFEATWQRARWFPKRLKRCQIDVPKGIPHEGKGENSWDCGADATYGMTCAARSIPEAVGALVGSVLHDRVRHGGWSDWAWHKETVEPEPTPANRGGAE